jgi:hypothetical protein
MPFPSYAQWWRFGPKNFDECVLEKMKGQAPGMIHYARKACREQFPEEEQEEELKRGEDYEVTWCGKTANTISGCLTLKGKYKVLRGVVFLSKQECNDPHGEFWVKATAEPPMFGSTYKFTVAEASSFKCAMFEFFGHRKK